jgi:hypothetical protein
MKNTDTLLGLPPIPEHLRTCSKCGRHQGDEGMGWISLDWGCKKCAPQNEERMLHAMATGERPS